MPPDPFDAAVRLRRARTSAIVQDRSRPPIDWRRRTQREVVGRMLSKPKVLLFNGFGRGCLEGLHCNRTRPRRYKTSKTVNVSGGALAEVRPCLAFNV